MEDDDEAALDEGMEPESATGMPDDGDEPDDGDAVATGGAVTRTLSVNKGTRPVSDKTRELLKAAVSKMKANGETGDDLEPLDHEEAPQEPATPTGDAINAAAEAKPAEAPPPAPPPPAPSLDPAVMRRLEEVDARAADLDAREQRLAEAERASDIAKLRELYYDKGAPAVVEFVKKLAGSLSDDELKDEIADLVTDLSAQFLGVNVPQAVKEGLEARRTRKSLKAWKADQERAAQEQAERAKAAQEDQNRVRVKGILQQEITKPEHAQNYRWLAAEPNAGEIIFDVVEAAHKKDGTQLTWQEAAKRANDYLHQQSLAWIDKRKHLLATAPAQGSAPNGQQQRSQGDPQVRRSQAQPPKPTTPTPPAPPSGKWDAEAHRRSVKAKFRQAFTRQDDDG